MLDVRLAQACTDQGSHPSSLLVWLRSVRLSLRRTVTSRVPGFGSKREAKSRDRRRCLGRRWRTVHGSGQGQSHMPSVPSLIIAVLRGRACISPPCARVCRARAPPSVNSRAYGWEGLIAAEGQLRHAGRHLNARPPAATRAWWEVTGDY